MPTTSSISVTAAAYSAGTVPYLTTATLTYDNSDGNNGQVEGNAGDPGNYPAATSYYTTKYYRTAFPTFSVGNVTGMQILLNVRQIGEPTRRSNRHCRVEIKKTSIQYYSISMQRWIRTYEYYLIPETRRESENVGGVGSAAEYFTLPNGDLSIRSGENARGTAGVTGPETVNVAGADMAVGYKFYGTSGRQTFPWADAEVVLITTPIRAVGPGSEKVYDQAAYTADLKIECFADASSGAFVTAFDGRSKPITNAWQNFSIAVGPNGRFTTMPPLGTAANPFPTLVQIGGLTTAAAVRTAIRTAVAGTSGQLNLQLVPANSTITDNASLTLDSATDLINGSRTVDLDCNGLTLTGAAATWHKVYDTLPIFGKFNFTPGNIAGLGATRIKIRIVDARVNGRYTTPSVPTTLSVVMRLGMLMIKCILETPDRTVSTETTWFLPTAMSDYFKTWANAFSAQYSSETTVTTESAEQAIAVWVVPTEPTGSNNPAMVLDTVTNLTVYNLTVRDRTQGDKQYAITQFGHAINDDVAFLAAKNIATTGIRVIKSNTVEIKGCIFYNLDAHAVTMDRSTLNYSVKRCTFHGIGGSALIRDLDYGTGDLGTVQGVNGLFEQNGFYRIGINQFSSPAIGAGANKTLTIKRNIIKEAMHSGISTGFPTVTRGTGATPVNFTDFLITNIIDGNLVDGSMKMTLGGGGIHVQGPRSGGLIKNNAVRNVGPTQATLAGSVTYGFYVGPGPGGNTFSRPVANLYYDFGSLLWTATNNSNGTNTPAWQVALYREATSADPADPASPAGLGTPDITYNTIAMATAPPTLGGVALASGGIVDRAAWFAAYGVAP